jgi:transcriptional regulator with XRE-family HTH domain
LLPLLRHAEGWTLRRLERESGVPMNTILAYQPLRRHPALSAVERLLVAMGWTWVSLELARALLREVNALDHQRG